MALFKIKRGLAADLPTSYVEGYCYVTTDDGKFYIDTSNSAAGRIVLNAAKADKATALATARSLQTNLASTTAALFDGSGNASIGVTGTLAVGNGGTGKTSWTKYGLVYASASSTLASLGVGTSGQVLSSKGTTSAPQWINQSNLAAGTAGKFASAQTIALTGDITGSASSQAGWSIATTLADSGVAAGSYGPSTNISPAHGGTFSVPYVTFDAKGRATSASTITITLPTDNNTHYTANLYLGGSSATSNATTAVSNPYLILRENNTNRNTVQLKSGGNISISGVNGVATFSVPTASGTVAGVTIVYPAASCTSFSSDSGTVTPLAVQKGAKMFAITRPDSSTVNAITRFSNTTGDVKDSKIIIEDVTNTKDTTKKAQVLAIPAEGGKKMVYGYCTDQTDGTSFIGGVFDASATSYPYSAGLAIGGTSGNLLWKGKRVLTADDIYSLPAATSTALGGVKIGYTASGKNYPVQLNSSNQMYVNVPWSNTDTHYTANLLLGASGATATSTTAVSNPYIILRENGTNRNQIQIKAGTNVTVSGDDGIITISSSYTDTNTHYTTKIYAGSSGATSNSTSAVSNPYLTVVDDTTYRAQVRFVGSGATSVSANGGTITISSSNTTYSASTGISLSGTTFSANLNSTTSLGTIGTTSKLYAVGVDAKGKLCVNVPWSDTNTDTKVTTAANTSTTKLYVTGCTGATTGTLSYNANVYINCSTGVLYGAAWNDYAEYRWVLKDKTTDKMPEPGRCVVENGNDSLSISNGRLQPGAKIISDTYGMCMGETEKAKTPIAVCGRVLAYPFERKVAFNVGDAVCSGPNGTVSRMTREEIMMYPERIIGTVVSKPTYKEWGPSKIPVNGRIWIQVK